MPEFVFLQDNGNCIANEEKREACFNACRKLARAVKESGAKLYFKRERDKAEDNRYLRVYTTPEQKPSSYSYVYESVEMD